MSGGQYGSPLRDMVGYGPNPPNPSWPKNAKVAVQFVVNYEEGAENNILHGDTGSEWLLSEIVGASSYKGVRHPNMESLYEYGSRAGFWRLHRMFTERAMPVTVFGCAMALERNPVAAKAMIDAGWEVATHGLRWIDYQYMGEDSERDHIAKAVSIQTRVCGSRPLGLYQGKPSPNTRRLAVAEGGFLYDSDAYNDELPYWNMEYGRPHLVIPYTLDANDMRFATSQGFNSGDQFYTYLKDSFDCLYKEGQAGSPKMMSVGLHCRLVGRPGRAAALARFLDYVKSHDDVWVTRRVDIAHHWYKNFYPASHPKPKL
ncbi:putative urate catabolism protein [Tribonema minus]|uniref:Putative urate catabolism protein n=1 Tax=Tribonema minus TaxID=303371 RepID=A0A836CM71_9STRA|nr:putative urate catabolism protein [Tribonema minus]